MATKTEGGQAYPKGDYAYTPDEEPSHWKLRLTKTPGGPPDPAIVGAAAAAFSPGGHRGQQADLPDDAQAGVKAKVRAAWKQANPDADPEDMPDSIQANEPTAQLLDLVYASNPELLPEAVRFAEARRADEPSGTDSHLDGVMGNGGNGGKAPRPLSAYHQKMLEHLKGKVTAEDYAAAVTAARAHAGGKASAAAKAATKREGGPTSVDDAKAASELAAQFTALWGGVPGDWDAALEQGAGCGCPVCGPVCMGTDQCDDCAADADDDDAEPWEIGPQLEKQDDRVEYREADTAGQMCAACQFYDGDDMACRLVEGLIKPDWVCNLFTTVSITPSAMVATEGATAAYTDIVDLCAHTFGEGDPTPEDPDYRLFVEMPAAFAEAEVPDWLPLLPKPGRYQHPQYGEILHTDDRIANFIHNFEDRVYQEHIPIDIEHDGKMSGAMGYMRELRRNDDGSADVRVEWTDVGRQVVASDAFRYVSPEWWDEWKQPATGNVYRDVLIGAALCTRPYFKDSDGSLRSLVATEGALLIRTGGASFGEPPQSSDPDPAPRRNERSEPMGAPLAASAESRQLAEAQTALRTAQEQLRKATEQITTVAAENAELKKANEAMVARQETIEASDRQRRFTDIVLGRGGANDGGPRFLGDVEKNVARLTQLAEKFGEDSEFFADEVAKEVERATSVQQSGAFREVGSSGRPEAAAGADPLTKLQGFAEELKRQNPSWSRAKAMTEAANQHKDLAAAYDRQAHPRH